MGKGAQFWIVVPLMSALIALACGNESGAPCPQCPAASLILAVDAATDAGALNGVQATLSGPTTVSVSCAPNGSEAQCVLGVGPLVAGSYSLRITAPNFKTATVTATVTYNLDHRCGCDWFSLQPKMVRLDPL
jgi:hypothetical protein